MHDNPDKVSKSIVSAVYSGQRSVTVENEAMINIGVIPSVKNLSPQS
jgi:hypothetical protein